MKAMSRPAIVARECVDALGAEMRAARWIYHRLLDFEDQHQTVLDEAAEQAAPRIVRVARIVARLLLRQKRRERSCEGTWSPSPHTEWLAALRGQLTLLRKRRNADPRWKEACSWADTPAEDAPDRGGVRRKASETDDEFAARCAKRRTKLTRREAYRKALYDAHVAGATERSRVYWGTWNALLASVDQARKSVLKRRKEGLPAEWRRPRWDDPVTIAADAGGFRILDKGGVKRVAKRGAEVGDPWWTVETRVRDGWVRFRAKFGNWHELPTGAELRTLKLTRRRGPGRGWEYSVSSSVAGMLEASHPGTGTVALDWGHREHGHPTEHMGIRVFTWRGDDGQTGEILLPRECRNLASEVDELKARVDATFNARKATLRIPERNRHGYRSRLLRAGARTSEEQNWLAWETRYERRMARARARIDNLRRETYTQAIRRLRQRYRVFALEDETIVGHRKLDLEEQTRHRKRQNRELSARYEFKQLCERSGAEVLPVTARNSTRECVHCGQLHENGPELYRVCPVTGLAGDKDAMACITILARAQEALAKRAA